MFLDRVVSGDELRPIRKHRLDLVNHLRAALHLVGLFRIVVPKLVLSATLRASGEGGGDDHQLFFIFARREVH